MALKVAFSRVVFLLSLVSFAVMAASEEKCQYVVRVKTGGRISAGTDATISLQLMSHSSNSLTVANLEDWGAMGSNHDYFERGNVDVFKGTGRCLNVCAITVTSNNSGYKSGWYLDYVEVIVSGDVSKEVSFPVNRWLADDEWPYSLSATVDACSSFYPMKPSLSSVLRE
ncbi:PLAT domain-containing protein 3 [Neltuma alba]|uniref:PLAT domain-containing protein 3 n=1 Tax=Neltuma alba TaxID=207710 RepID=UPI0010A406D6|nr:PLAT domain-containing protein 3-like [Prosopis alba]